ncbi:hypothetical protein CRYUN_Cryun09bG0215600 [Craigia yunnanensis]
MTVVMNLDKFTFSECKLNIRADQILGLLHGKCCNEFEPRSGADGLAIWLVDFQGWAKGSISVKVTRETAHILQDHYPERLGLGIFYNPPKIYESFWMIVKPFLEPKTYKKVKFVYSDDTKSQKIIEEIFYFDKLDAAFGGRNTAGFDYQAYAQQICSSPPHPSSILSESHQSESLDLDHDSNASDECGSSSGDDATPPNLECIDEKIQELSFNCKDIQNG